LIAATDGNHGRAVAHTAALLGFEAHILVPQDMSETRQASSRFDACVSISVRLFVEVICTIDLRFYLCYLLNKCLIYSSI
jgi:hypothetical protein